MVIEPLDLHLQLLVLQYGRTRVLQSIASISQVSEENILIQLKSLADAKAGRSARVLPTADKILSRMELPDSKRERLARLAREFENKRFLGELRLVGKFLREHQAGKIPKTRVQALSKVLTVLAAMSEQELDGLLYDCAVHNESGGSGFSNLAGAIMGQ